MARDRDRSRERRRGDSSRRRSRSRSPRRRRSRSRSPYSHTSRDRYRGRRSRSPQRARLPSPTSQAGGARKQLDVGALVTMTDRDAAEKTLEEEMKRRRERIERWRQEKKRQDELKRMAAAADEQSKLDAAVDAAEKLRKPKKWTLDGEDDEEDEEDPDVKPTTSAASKNGKDAGSEPKDDCSSNVGTVDLSESSFDRSTEQKPMEIDSTEEKANTADTFDPPAPAPETAETPPTKPSASVEKEDNKQEAKPEEEEPEEEVDPLDAYMLDVNAQVRKLMKKPMGGKAGGKGNQTSKSRVTVVRTSAKSAAADTLAGTARKGEVVEQGADAADWSDNEKDFDMDRAFQSLATRARQLPATDHAKVYYKPFRRDFYVEVPEVAAMSDAEVTKYREELEDIKVRGKNCPKPIKNWAHCIIQPQVLNLMRRLNYEKPTPIQAQALPAIMSGRDVIGIAKTGSGKTLAFLLPMFRHIMDQEPLDEMDGPIAMVLSPTRELALQTMKECRRFAKVLGMTAVCVYGGAGITEQIAELKRGAEIVICTPGRMIDMLAANSGRVTNLRRVTYLVLDEADRMFDMGFEPQVMRIVGNVRPDRQTVMFSATFPRQMEALARKALKQPIEILVGQRSTVNADIEQHVVIIDEDQKIMKLLELLGVYCEFGSVLIFVEKQEKADDLVGDLMKHGYNCAPLHGAIDQIDRDSTIIDFKTGKIKVLVATSVAARGLDVKKLVLVVNFDCPNHYEDYVHRVGRTGRAGNKGYAYTFLLPQCQERYAGELIKHMEQAKQPVPPELQKMFDDFKAKMEEEGKEIHLGGGGFGGHGYQFDAAEAEEACSKKQMEKLVRGMEQGAGEDDDEIDSQIATLMKSKTRVADPKEKLPAGSSKADVQASKLREKALAKAKQAAKQIQANKNLQKVEAVKDINQQTAEAVLKGVSALGTMQFSAKTMAQQLAEKLNERIGYIPTESPDTQETEETEFKIYEEELEINDFPQAVRYRVCSREVINMIQEDPEVGVTVKGSYIPKKKKKGTETDGDRPLYLFIEATNELSLNTAKTEIVRVIKDAMRNMMVQVSRQAPSGRYKVL